MKALAPAKLNLCLYVGAKRQDGLHEICSLFQPVTLADELVAELSEGDGDEVVCPGVAGPNLAAEALARFRQRFGWDAPPLRVTIDKKIPVAAGLGGGSADAAAALRLGMAASGIRPSPDELSSLAMSLGADVPSQLEPSTALVTGAGERVEPLGKPMKVWAVLLTGQASLSTAHVYARADALRASRADLDEVTSRLRTAVQQSDGEALALASLLENDLQDAAVDLEPAAGEALRLLEEAGAKAKLVAGSGPAAFGLFASREDAEGAASAIEGRWPGAVTVVEAVGSGSSAPVGT